MYCSFGSNNIRLQEKQSLKKEKWILRIINTDFFFCTFILWIKSDRYATRILPKKEIKINVHYLPCFLNFWLVIGFYLHFPGHMFRCLFCTNLLSHLDLGFFKGSRIVTISSESVVHSFHHTNSGYLSFRLKNVLFHLLKCVQFSVCFSPFLSRSPHWFCCTSYFLLWHAQCSVPLQV